MNKRFLTIFSLISGILIIISIIVKTTYSLIVNIGSYDNPNEFTIKELITDEYGGYNNYYYDATSKLGISDEEANILINSDKLNEALNDIINNKYHQGKLSNREIIKIITDAINSDSMIKNELKIKVNEATETYINELSNYIYDINKRRTINK